MMNLFENLQTMNEITTKHESIDDYFDKLISEIQNKYNYDVLVENRNKMSKKYKDCIIDKITLEDLMVLIIKGVK